MIPVFAFVVLLLIGLCLCIGGAVLIVVEGVIDNRGSWIPWVWVLAGAWVITVALSGAPFTITMDGGQ